MRPSLFLRFPETDTSTSFDSRASYFSFAFLMLFHALDELNLSLPCSPDKNEVTDVITSERGPLSNSLSNDSLKLLKAS